MFDNTTINQHYLSAVEQRLNAANPQADPDNQKIHEFLLSDRDGYQLEHLSARSILKNMSWLDLFSFEVVRHRRMRKNLEALFHRYEDEVACKTHGLLQKIAAGEVPRDEVIDLLAIKLLNFIRNPYCVTKMLNTFPRLRGMEPTDPVLHDAYRRIAAGSRPSQNTICSRFGMTPADYQSWLQTLLMLVAPMQAGLPNFLEQLVKVMIEDRRRHISVFVCIYTAEKCLLSDRGFCEPTADKTISGFSFNLNSSAFITYIFTDFASLYEGKVPAHLLDMFQKRSDPVVQITPCVDNFELLGAYNRRVIDQCHSHVYCAGLHPFVGRGLDGRAA